MSMFCFQCQETAKGTGCTVRGVCGKTEEVAKLQDLIVYASKGIAEVVIKTKTEVGKIKEVNEAVITALFATITNANFDESALESQIRQLIAHRDKLRGKSEEGYSNAATFSLGDRADMLKFAEEVGVLRTENEDVRSLREMIIYGLKGMAAYLHHAENKIGRAHV